MLTRSPAQVGAVVSLMAGASLTMLSERVHRGSLANARRAIDESRAVELRSQAVLREVEAWGAGSRLAASG